MEKNSREEPKSGEQLLVKTIDQFLLASVGLLMQRMIVLRFVKM